MKPVAIDPGDYDFAVPPLVRFGCGRIREVGEVAALYGRVAWLVTGGRSFAASGAEALIAESLRRAGMASHHVAATHGEPTVDDVVAAAEEGLVAAVKQEVPVVLSEQNRHFYLSKLRQQLA